MARRWTRKISLGASEFLSSDTHVRVVSGRCYVTLDKRDAGILERALRGVEEVRVLVDRSLRGYVTIYVDHYKVVLRTADAVRLESVLRAEAIPKVPGV